jgi:hypothetical protein
LASYREKGLELPLSVIGKSFNSNLRSFFRLWMLFLFNTHKQTPLYAFLQSPFSAEDPDNFQGKKSVIAIWVPKEDQSLLGKKQSFSLSVLVLFMVFISIRVFVLFGFWRKTQ